MYLYSSDIWGGQQSQSLRPIEIFQRSIFYLLNLIFLLIQIDTDKG